MSSISVSASAAPRWPSSRIVSIRARRERTSAYSPMTKNALRAMSSAVATSSSAVIAERRVSRYFEGDRLTRAVRGRRLAAASRGTEAVARRGLPLVVAMRIVSLVPHATELLFALGLGDDVVAVTHECDFPSQTARLPTVTRDALPPGLTAGEIDAAVRERTERGQAIYELDKRALAELEPDLIVTQELCAVCAVSYDDVRKVADTLPSHPKVIALDPTTLGESMGDIRTIAQATGARDAALDLVARQRGRIDAVRRAVRHAEPVPVAALEWLDPGFVAGHWTPQLIELAGGRDVLGFPREHSAQSTWEAVAAAPARGWWSACPAATTARARTPRRWPTPTGWPRWAPSGSSRSTPPPTSRAPARGWSTASSCWPTCSTPTSCPMRRARRTRSRSERPHRPLPPQRERPLRRGPPAAGHRHRPGPRALPGLGRPAGGGPARRRPARRGRRGARPAAGRAAAGGHVAGRGP